MLPMTVVYILQNGLQCAELYSKEIGREGSYKAYKIIRVGVTVPHSEL